MAVKHGQITYTDRAFHQDATEAMKGDIVRGLIEAITNSDDAYGSSTGKILIEIEHRRGPWSVTIRDRARGMRTQEMEEKIAKIGGRTSGFERGESVRGNLGRGAKDLAAFGEVTFRSIRDDRRSQLILSQTGHYELYDEVRVTEEDRLELGISRGSGTVVSINVGENITCPRHENLRDRLSKHYQLRDILADPKRDVLLVNLNTKDSTSLRYAYPSLNIVLEKRLILNDYPEAKIALVINRNQERYDDSSSDPCRVSGLLIKGRRAVYESTLFRFEGKAHAGWFSGVVHCPYIDFLATDYDDRRTKGKEPDKTNPFPIIRRGRDGLERSHPFYKALSTAVETELEVLIADEEARHRAQGAKEAPELRRSLDHLQRDLAQLIDEDLKDLDEEGIPEDANHQGNVPPMKLIPEQTVLYLGHEKTLTLQIRSDVKSEDSAISFDPEGVVELLSRTPFVVHKQRPDLVIQQIRFRPLVPDRETLVAATSGEHSAIALLEVRSERPTPPELSIPETLQFERDSYRLQWGKRRLLRIIAPRELVTKKGRDLRVLSSDAGVIVLGQDSVLVLDKRLGFSVAESTVEARTLGARAVLRAELHGVVATSNVIVIRNETGPEIDIRIVAEEAGHRRALVEHKPNGLLIKIMGCHQAMRRYLGPPPDFAQQNLTASRAVIAEIVAGEAARMIMERKHRMGAGRDLSDAAAMYVEHSKLLHKYLNRCHTALVVEATLKQSGV
jgi:hypothetical protein